MYSFQITKLVVGIFSKLTRYISLQLRSKTVLCKRNKIGTLPQCACHEHTVVYYDIFRIMTKLKEKSKDFLP